jgi:hypothetical protein
MAADPITGTNWKLYGSNTYLGSARFNPDGTGMANIQYISSYNLFGVQIPWNIEINQDFAWINEGNGQYLVTGSYAGHEEQVTLNYDTAQNKITSDRKPGLYLAPPLLG